MGAQPTDSESDIGARALVDGPCLLENFSETDRLAVLAEYDADALRGDSELGAITDFAAKLCAAPIALVSLVEEHRQMFVVRQGLEASETPRSMSFCQHAMLHNKVFEVGDARDHPVFRDNPLVSGPPHIRFYAGAPLISDEGMPLGSLCVIDPVARPEGLTDLQREGLTVLANAVMRRLSGQRESIAAEAALDESDSRFNALADAIPQMAWSTPPDGMTDYFNRRWEEFTGAAAHEHFGTGWLDALHPEDVDSATAAWRSAVESGQPYEVEYRMRRSDGEYRWTLARGLPLKDDDGRVRRWFGTNTDIHERRELEESRDLMSRELSHRIKNIFSLVGGLLSFESRATPELKPLTAAVTARISALGRAHDYVRPDSDGVAKARNLHGLLDDLFAVHVDGDTRRIQVSGGDMPIDGETATPLALIFHELATNAVKYGALSTDDGTVRIAIKPDGDALSIEWREEGGPDRVDGQAIGEGFGHNLIDTSVTRQLRGTIERGWDRGFTATISVPLDGSHRTH